MPDWAVRQHRVTLIRFEGRSWRVAGKTTAGGKINYELTPWVPADEYVSGHEIDYGAAYVAARDRSATRSRRSSYVTSLLRVVSPFVGFLPAATKGRLETRYGIDPVATTFQSVFLETIITLGAFALASVGEIILAHTKGEHAGEGTTAGFPVGLLFAVGLISAIDGSMRYSRILAEERPPPGFCEWIVRRRPPSPKIDR